MEIQTQLVTTTGIRLSVSVNDLEIARAYLYVMRNDLHDEPFGLLEDVCRPGASVTATMFSRIHDCDNKRPFQ